MNNVVSRLEKISQVPIGGGVYLGTLCYHSLFSQIEAETKVLFWENYSSENGVLRGV